MSEWTDMHEGFKEVRRKIGAHRCRQQLPVWIEVAWRQPALSTKGPNLAIWSADVHQALRFCEEQHATVEGSESSHVSFDRADDPWPSSLGV